MQNTKNTHNNQKEKVNLSDLIKLKNKETLLRKESPQGITK